jgi:hydroxyacylglutathione hydrolase
MLQSQTTNIMKVSLIKAFSDNYIWAISTNKNTATALVDPGDAAVCIAHIEQHGLQLSAILITHHHHDHVGGIEQLRNYCAQKQWPLTVYGPKNENIPYCDIKLEENDIAKLSALSVEFTIIDLPGHTSGHIAYLAQDNLFCGDTLFSGGCGRLFEGTPEKMLSSLNKLNALSDKTHVYCAHEYTEANLNFALAVEPGNSELIHYYNQVIQKRAENIPTIPSSMLVEKKINPFLRCEQPEIMASASEYSGSKVEDSLTTFTVIRAWKDNF